MPLASVAPSLLNLSFTVSSLGFSLDLWFRAQSLGDIKVNAGTNKNPVVIRNIDLGGSYLG